MYHRRIRDGVTLIELLVVMAIVALIIGLLLPALSAAREASRATHCQNNLREIGVGLIQYADVNNEFMCSGAFDWKRDGVVTEVGWVADLVNSGIDVSQLNCQSNSAQVSLVYNDLLTATATSAGFSCDVDHNGGTPTTELDGTLHINPCRVILGEWTGTWDSPWGTTYSGGSPLAPNTEERRKLVDELILKKGYNTNYATSWWLTRSGLKVNRTGNPASVTGLNDLGSPCPTSDATQIAMCNGPLNRRGEGSQWAASSSAIPIVGDANVGKVEDAVLAQDLDSASAGSPLAESMTAGPRLITTLNLPSFPAGTPLNGPTGWKAAWKNKTIQDYRNFGPTHGSGKNRYCQILFQDGSVRRVVDSNGDRFLNAGFDPSAYTGVGDIGITDDSIELEEKEFYSAWTLKRGYGVGR